MSKYKRNLDNIQIKLPRKTKIDTDMLNYISSGESDYFCKCSYYEKDGEHNLVFDIKGKISIDSRFYHFSFRECIELLKCLHETIQFVIDNSLGIKNLILSCELIFSGGNKYNFIYIPVKENITEHDYIKKKVIKIIAGFHIKEERILDLIKQLNNSCSDEMTLKIIESFIDKYSEDDGYDIRIFSSVDEGETTIFSNTSPDEDDEGETTVFRNTSSDEDDEGETTVFRNALLDEDETMMFQNGAHNMLLQKEDGIEKTEVYDDISSECETVLFQESDEDERYKYKEEGYPYLVQYINGEAFEIKSSEFKIGKNPETMDMVLNNRSVSRYHAVITLEDNTYFIMDNGSTNGTMIEGVMLKPFEKVELGDGSIITFGDEIVQFRLGRR